MFRKLRNRKSSLFFSPLTEEHWEKKPTIILIPGYYGSSLYDQKGKLRFPFAGQALGGKFSLALEQGRLHTPKSEELYPRSVVGRVAVLPWIFAEEAYSSSLAGHESFANFQKIYFAYDWRKDLFRAMESLDDLIQSLRNSGVEDIRLFAHSMGGLLTAYFLRYGNAEPQYATETWHGASLVKKALFLGVPFHGAMAAFRDMQHGTPFYWNRHLLSAEAVSSFPAAYYLLPRPVPGGPQTEAIPRQIIDYETWDHFSWGLLRKNRSPARREYTKHWLEKSNAFFALLHAPSEIPCPLPCANIYGIGSKTMARVHISHEGKLDFKKPACFDDGDGTVTALSAAAPSFLRGSPQFTEEKTVFTHGRLWLGAEVREKIVDFICR